MPGILLNPPKKTKWTFRESLRDSLAPFFYLRRHKLKIYYFLKQIVKKDYTFPDIPGMVSFNINVFLYPDFTAK
jgi:hypothetical protein